MISPCILVCSIDTNTGCCSGCGRTRDEIAGWIGYSDAERRSIMDALPARPGSAERGHPGKPPRQRTTGEGQET